MERKRQRILIAGGGSTYTAGIVTMLIESVANFLLNQLNYMIIMMRDKEKLLKHVQ
ncbi:maltose-6'-phosphate glucosidase domain protein [Clostridioides difficile CD8]|uniref:maltose-6'-phosphate glucosidase domain protein n=1 Tax=Clostridioides difficile TaxID=1496 RepID=UPI00038DB8C2|nr:maltose-6'-phosphate glucosidase domain protein [Clostridioides difficile]EQE03065.1 maltose-6'-phosphate glucosidase domain protein [Clostridioides difficile CD8]